MSTIVAKLLFPFSMILSLISGSIYPPYLQLGAESFTFDYKGSGLNRPYDLLSVKNIGPQKVRIDVSTDAGWIFITQEGYENVHTLELDVENTVNFVLDIRTDLVNDGQHTGKVTVDAVYLQDKSILDTKDVSVILNKNYIPTPTPTPTLIATETPTETPVATIVETPLATEHVSPAVSVTPTKAPSKTPVPTVRISPSPTRKAESTKLVSPTVSPEASKQAGMPEEVKKSMWQIITDWFSKIF